MSFKLEKYDTNKNCRVCLHVSTEMIPLFGRGASYSEMLMKCSKVNVEENDGLPVVMCEYCVKKMTDACEFVDKCQETDRQLRLYLEMRVTLDEVKIDIKEIKDEPDFSDYQLDDFNLSENYKEEVDESCDGEDEILSEKVKKWKLKKKKAKKRDSLNKNKNQSSNLKCEQCGLFVRSKSAMIIHLATHSEDRPFQCKECNKTYRSRGNLRKHVVTSHSGLETRRYKCTECNRAFHCKSELIVHSRTHTGDTPYQCEWCPKAFTQISALSRHRLTHTGEKPFQCAVCGKKFSTRDNLKGHMMVHSSEKKFSCKICGLLLKTKSSLTKHQLMHTDIKAFVCDQCGRPFRTKGNLKLHMEKKHSERSGFCTICSKRYSDMEEHNNLHTGQTPFQCAVCNKQYGVKRSLLVHMRKHDNPEKFSCEYDGCTKKFPIKCMLDFHVLKYHKKQTPYICEYCNRGFFRLNDLNLHKKMNHLCMDINKKPLENKIENIN